MTSILNLRESESSWSSSPTQIARSHFCICELHVHTVQCRTTTSVEICNCASVSKMGLKFYVRHHPLLVYERNQTYGICTYCTVSLVFVAYDQMSLLYHLLYSVASSDRVTELAWHVNLTCQQINLHFKVSKWNMQMQLVGTSYFNSKSWKLVFRGFPYMGMFDWEGVIIPAA